MRVITLGSGHRGTGKSFLTAHLGLALARQGVNTCVVDLDFRAADLHLMLGVYATHGRNLRDVLDGRLPALASAALPVPGCERLRIVPGPDETIRSAAFDDGVVRKLRRDLAGLRADVVLMDVEAGSSSRLIDLFLLGDDQWVVARREPRSLQDAARLLRRARLRMSTRGSAVAAPSRPRVYTSLDDLVRDMSAIKADQEAGADSGCGRRALLLNRCRPEQNENPDAWLESLLEAGDEAGSLPVIAEVPEDGRVGGPFEAVPSLSMNSAGGPVERAIAQLAESMASELEARIPDTIHSESPELLPA